jgi:hypothetical protein
MLPITRIELARLSYESAVRAVRESSTPHTWARLLRAARNLREASSRDGHRAAHGTRHHE